MAGVCSSRDQHTSVCSYVICNLFRYLMFIFVHIVCITAYANAYAWVCARMFGCVGESA